MKNIKIGQKLIGAFLITAAITAILGFYLEGLIRDINKRDTQLFEQGIVPFTLLVTSVEQAQELRVNIRRWQISKTPEARAATLKDMEAAHKILTEAISKQIGLAMREETKRALMDYQAAVDKYLAEANKFASTTTKFSPEGINTETLSDAVLNAAAEMTRLTKSNIEIKTNATNILSKENDEIAKKATGTAMVLIPITVIFSILMGVFLTFSITRPLSTVMDVFSKMENGDMTVRASLERGDEFGVLSKALDSMSSRLQSIFRNLRQDSEILASSAEELSAVSRQISNSAEENVSQSATVASATEQASVSMNTIAAAMEEMSASIRQISSNAGEANKVANEASAKSSEATGVMGRLGVAAKEIGQVTDVIKKIADKTNLLALNATIEAASAGNAGKGFAVVAGEIKELANQSAQSADDITRRIESIQSGTTEAVSVIKNVSNIITNMNQSVEVISIHVDQQTKASNEIANNAGETAKGSSVISQSVASIAQGAKDSVQGARQINQSVSELSKLAGDLKSVLSQFKV